MYKRIFGSLVLMTLLSAPAVYSQESTIGLGADGRHWMWSPWEAVGRSGTPFRNSGIGIVNYGGGAGLGPGYFSRVGGINYGIARGSLFNRFNAGFAGGAPGIVARGNWGNGGLMGYGANAGACPGTLPCNGIGFWNDGVNIQNYYASRGVVNWAAPSCAVVVEPEPNRCSANSVTIARPRTLFTHRYMHHLGRKFY